FELVRGNVRCGSAKEVIRAESGRQAGVAGAQMAACRGRIVKKIRVELSIVQRIEIEQDQPQIGDFPRLDFEGAFHWEAGRAGAGAVVNESGNTRQGVLSGGEGKDQAIVVQVGAELSIDMHP